MTTVINLFGGPGAGKSTMAAGLFHMLKNEDLRVELVTEYAKELAYEGTLDTTSQHLILREQARRLNRLIGKVDWVITDSPLLLGLIYHDGPMRPEYECQVWIHHQSYNNLNFLLQRVKRYRRYGRAQTEGEAGALCTRIRQLLERHHVAHLTVPGDVAGLASVARYVVDCEVH